MKVEQIKRNVFGVSKKKKKKVFRNFMKIISNKIFSPFLNGHFIFIFILERFFIRLANKDVFKIPILQQNQQSWL